MKIGKVAYRNPNTTFEIPNIYYGLFHGIDIKEEKKFLVASLYLPLVHF